MLNLKEGILIPVSERIIVQSGHDDGDNPICNAISDFLYEQSKGLRYTAYFCLIDEKIPIYRKGVGGKLLDLWTTTMLEDWLRAYYKHTKVLRPFTLKIFHQRDDNGEIEDERLWIGVYEDGEGVSEYDLEKLYGLLSYDHIQNAQVNAIVAVASGVNENDTCPLTNVLEEMTEHLCMEIGICDNQAEFYQDESDFCTAIPFTNELIWWLDQYNGGKEVKECVIYISRDDTLPDQPLYVGIDHAICKYNVVDFDHLDGMEGRVTRWHIDKSIRGNCDACAIATTLLDMFPHYEVNVDGEQVLIHTRGTEHAVLLISERLGNWIDAYDNENEVGTFTLIVKKLDDNEYYKYMLDIRDLTDREKDLQDRISTLSSKSAEMELFIQKQTDRGDDEFNAILQEYEELFGETVYEFGR